jgi:hypothetical protein
MNESCADPDAPLESCFVCGKSIHTCERKEAVNNSYLCPVHGDGWQRGDGAWICSEECDQKYEADKPRHSSLKFFHPFNFVFVKRPKTDDPNWHPSDDLHQYGFSLDLTTELYFYTYDWGRGFNFRVLGFGFEVCFNP